MYSPRKPTIVAVGGHRSYLGLRIAPYSTDIEFVICDKTTHTEVLASVCRPTVALIEHLAEHRYSTRRILLSVRLSDCLQEPFIFAYNIFKA